MPVLMMKKKVIISRAPHRGSISLPTSTTVKMSTATWTKNIHVIIIMKKMDSVYLPKVDLQKAVGESWKDFD